MLTRPEIPRKTNISIAPMSDPRMARDWRLQRQFVSASSPETLENVSSGYGNPRVASFTELENLRVQVTYLTAMMTDMNARIKEMEKEIESLKSGDKNNGEDLADNLTVVKSDAPINEDSGRLSGIKSMSKIVLAVPDVNCSNPIAGLMNFSKHYLNDAMEFEFEQKQQIHVCHVKFWGRTVGCGEDTRKSKAKEKAAVNVISRLHKEPKILEWIFGEAADSF